MPLVSVCSHALMSFSADLVPPSLRGRLEQLVLPEWHNGSLVEFLAVNNGYSVGLGEIGTRIARLAQGFGMNVVYASRTEKPASGLRRLSLQELLEASDAVFLTLPLSEETGNLIDEQAFERMRPTSILVNVSSAGLIDDAALHQALVSNQIAGAAVDIVVPPAYLEMPRTTITPIHGWYTPEGMHRRAAVWVETLASGINGDPRNVVIGDALR